MILRLLLLRGFTNPTSSTGTFTNPTLITPTIASFLNSVHNHQNNVSGGQLDFSALLSTIFSGQVQTYTQTGDGGGTGYYINLGGIKLCWGISGTFSSPGGTNKSVSFPTSFFTTIQTAFMIDVFAQNTTVYAMNSVGTTGLSAFVSTANSTMTWSWFAIGT
jgi:hypothetical protein